MHPSRFTGRQITTMMVAAALAVIAFPVGVFAATGSIVTIADPTHSARKAHVSAAGHLLATVDGTVVSRTGPPSRVWSYAEEQAGPSDIVLPITGDTINVTGLTVTSSVADASVQVNVLRFAGSATSCTATIQSVQHLYIAQHIAEGTPLTASFVTPLQSRPAGHKLCLAVFAPGTTVSLNGYYGS